MIADLLVARTKIFGWGFEVKHGVVRDGRKVSCFRLGAQGSSALFILAEGKATAWQFQVNGLRGPHGPRTGLSRSRWQFLDSWAASYHNARCSPLGVGAHSPLTGLLCAQDRNMDPVPRGASRASLLSVATAQAPSVRSAATCLPVLVIAYSTNG